MVRSHFPVLSCFKYVCVCVCVSATFFIFLDRMTILLGDECVCERARVFDWWWSVIELGSNLIEVVSMRARACGASLVLWIWLRHHRTFTSLTCSTQIWSVNTCATMIWSPIDIRLRWLLICLFFVLVFPIHLLAHCPKVHIPSFHCWLIGSVCCFVFRLAFCGCGGGGGDGVLIIGNSHSNTINGNQV